MISQPAFELPDLVGAVGPGLDCPHRHLAVRRYGHQRFQTVQITRRPVNPRRMPVYNGPTHYMTPARRRLTILRQVFGPAVGPVLSGPESRWRKAGTTASMCLDTYPHSIGPLHDLSRG